MTKPGPEIIKSLSWKIGELIQSLQIIRDSLNAIRLGHLHYVIPLSGQLRALLTDKSRKNTPLLLELAKTYGQDMRIHAMSGHEEDDLPIKEGIVLHVKGFPIGLKKELPRQELISFTDFLDREIIQYRDKKYSVGELIGWFANQAGGAHYSKRVPEDFSHLLHTQLFGRPLLVDPLLQVGVLCLQLGVRFLKQRADLQFHLLIGVPKCPSAESAYIFDAVYPNTPMRIFLRLDRLGKLEFGINTLFNQTITLKANQLLEWNEPRYVQAHLTILDDLSTRLEMSFDGEVIAVANMPGPYFISAEFRDYDVYWNRPASETSQTFEFGIAQYFVANSESTPRTYAQTYAYIEDQCGRPELSFIVFLPGAYGNAPPGKGDMTMTGEVLQRNAWEYLGLPPPAVNTQEKMSS